MSLIELLRSGRIEEFNARRGQRVTLDLFGADLAGLALAGVDLTGANLEKADLSGADLTGATLARADLSGADLTGATLDRVVAIKARLREAYLGDARAMEGEWAGADFTEADLTGFVGDRGRYVGTRFKAATLTGAHLRQADLTEARFGDADLRHADLEGSVLRGAELGRANLSGARLERVDLTSARLGQAQLKAAVLRGAVLVQADLTGADLTGADLEGANLDRADLQDAVLDDGVARGAMVAPEPEADAPAEIHFDDPTVAATDGLFAILWDNADADQTLTIRVMVCSEGGEAEGTSVALPVDADQVLARALVPLRTGFAAVALVERPAGVEVVLVPVAVDGSLGAARTARLGYQPAVKPVITGDGDGVLIHGIGRQGALSVHRFAGGELTEVARAPAATFRGFCGRLDPILLGKGGTIAEAGPLGIGRLLSAPAGYPGRLVAAARDGTTVAVAWSGREERGLRFAVIGDGEPARLDAKSDIGSLDLVAHGGRWLVVWTREAEPAEAWAAWLPGGAPFRLPPSKFPGLEEIRMVAGGARPRVLLTGLDDEVVVVEVGEAAGTVVGRFTGG